MYLDASTKARRCTCSPDKGELPGSMPNVSNIGGIKIPKNRSESQAPYLQGKMDPVLLHCQLQCLSFRVYNKFKITQITPNHQEARTTKVGKKVPQQRTEIFPPHKSIQRTTAEKKGKTSLFKCLPQQRVPESGFIFYGVGFSYF